MAAAVPLCPLGRPPLGAAGHHSSRHQGPGTGRGGSTGWLSALIEEINTSPGAPRTFLLVFHRPEHPTGTSNCKEEGQVSSSSFQPLSVVRWEWRGFGTASGSSASRLSKLFLFPCSKIRCMSCFGRIQPQNQPILVIFHTQVFGYTFSLC